MSPGAVQLPPPGDLPADDWSAVGGRGPGESGSLNTAAARPLRFLSVSVAAGGGGGVSLATFAAVTQKKRQK